MTEIPGLHILLRQCFFPVIPGKFEFFQFRDAVDKQRHIRPELLGDLLLSHDRVFDYVMEEARRNCLFIQFEIRKDQSHIEGMDDIRLARFPLLPFVRPAGHRVGLLDQGNIVGRMVSADTLNKIRIQFFRTYIFADILYSAPVEFL